MADALRFSDKYDVYPDKSSIFAIGSDKASYHFTQLAVIPKGRSFSAGIAGHRFVFGDPNIVEIINEPKLVKFTGIDNCIGLFFKHSDENIYHVGISVKDLIAFKPPASSPHSDL